MDRVENNPCGPLNAIPPPQIRAQRVAKDYIDMNFDELRPNNMRAYSELAFGASELLETLVHELRSQVSLALRHFGHKESAR
jgi:hypothetical protein